MAPKSSLAGPGHNALMILEPSLIAHHLVKAWLDSGNRIAAIWTETQRPGSPRASQRFRATASGAPPFGLVATKQGIPIRTINRLSPTPLPPREVERTGADVLITAMTMQIIPEPILEMFGRRAVNIHPSLLPHYRGKCPRLSMLYDGTADEFGGVTLHRLSPKIDEGPIISQRHLPWSKTPDFAVWDLAAAWATAEMIEGELMAYLAGAIDAAPQSPGDGAHRKCRKNGFDITSGMDLATARRLFDHSLGYCPPWKPSADRQCRRSYPVVSIRKVVGKPTGQPPRITPFAVETDLSDARVRLGRRNSLHILIRHPVWRIWSARRKLELAPPSSVPHESREHGK